ncbi:DEAD/DEAH box helicase [candidate division KSB1 bacterium]|nr:DEAD/DEAH box helicase [candidate division KSB1 bacterium]
MIFDQFSFDPNIHKGIKIAGYVTPTPIQEKAIPLVLEGGDVLGLAQTGTGKTAVFVLPILQRLMKGPRRRVRALIIAPTRELAEQIHQASIDLGKMTGIRSVSIYGGVSKNPQLAALKRGVEIVVACPGRLLDHLGERAIDLSHVEVLVLDEADRMCDMGFLPDIRRIIKYLPQKRQTLFFSATMPDEIRSLADSILNNPKTVQIGISAPVETVSHALYPVPQELKKALLFAMLKQTSTGRVLIFTRTKHRAKSLAAQLLKKNYRVSALQGNMSQNRRQDAINGFRGNKYDVLVATDIAARGIDVSDVTHVINFDMPDTVDAYTHRIGRTGRALQTGDAFTFAVKDDDLMLRSIEKVLGSPIERRSLTDFNYGDFIPENQFKRKHTSEIPMSRKPKSAHVFIRRQGAKEISQGGGRKRLSSSDRGGRGTPKHVGTATSRAS